MEELETTAVAATIGADFVGRRAPYAPISALERFFARIRDRHVPDIVDHTFLVKLNVASNNEYSLLSALKFLGIVGDRGRPTPAYRLLQTTDRFEITLKHLVETAYKPVFDAGIDELSQEDMVNFFRVSSSASQAKNAARFFYAVCRLAGFGTEEAMFVVGDHRLPPPWMVRASSEVSGSAVEQLLQAKAALIRRMANHTAEWSADEYQAILDRFLTVLESLDRDIHRLSAMESSSQIQTTDS